MAPSATTSQTGNESSRAAQAGTLDQALDQLYMLYQPIVRSTAGPAMGHEALLRSLTPGLQTPTHVLALASALGRLTDVDDRVRAAIATMAATTKLDGSFFVNLDMGELTRGLLATEGDPLLPIATRVVLELGGHAPNLDDPRTFQTLIRARQCGYRLAVGEVGNTISDLMHLRALQPDIYKVDWATMMKAERRNDGPAGLTLLVELARWEGAEVAALRIQDDHSLREARDAGCSLFQGNQVRRPAAAPRR